MDDAHEKQARKTQNKESDSRNKQQRHDYNNSNPTKKEPQTFIKNCKITLKMFETYKNSNIRLHYNTKLNYFLFHLSSLCHRQIQQQNVINPPWLWIRCWLCVVGYSFFTWSRGRPLIKRRKKYLLSKHLNLERNFRMCALFAEHRGILRLFSFGLRTTKSCWLGHSCLFFECSSRELRFAQKKVSFCIYKKKKKKKNENMTFQ